MRFKRLLLAVFVALFVFIPSIYAQDSDWYYNKPISQIRFKGLVNYNDNEFRGITSTFLGKSFTDELFAELMDKLFALDYFEDIDPIALPADKDYKTVLIEINVKENPMIQKIRFLGNRRVRDNSIKDTLSSKEKAIYYEDKRIADETAIRNFYYSKGYSEVSVTSEVTYPKESEAVITFTINEGRQTVVTEILFTGNRIASASTLRNKLVTKKSSLFNRGGFQDAVIEQDKKAILTYYADHGYVDARVIDVTQSSVYNEKKLRQEVTLTYNIEEGTQYTFGGLSLQGNKVFSTEELLGLVKLHQGDVFNVTKFNEGMTAIQNRYYDNGYWSNQFVPQVDKNSDEKTIAYRVYIQEGVRSHIESITVTGNSRTKEEVILREIPAEAGDIFSNKKIQTGLRDLYNLQYFSSIIPDIKPGSEDNLVDINFDVSEKSTRSVQFGLTFAGTTSASELPISLFASIADTNLFGEGKSASLSTSLSTTSQSVSVGYGQDWIFGKPIANSVSLTYAHSKNSTPRAVFLPDGRMDNSSYYMDYEQHRFTLSDNISRRWAMDWGTLTVGGGISTSLLNNLYDGNKFTPAAIAISDYHNKWNPRNSISIGASFDARDFYFNPSKGWFLSQSLTWYGLMPKGKFIFPENFGESEFILRSTTIGEKYFQLLNAPVTDNYNLQVVLMGSSTLTMQRPYFGSGISKNSQLYLDGVLNTRGWEIYDDNAGRGNLTWTNSLELRIPVWPNAVALDFIFDASMIKDDMKDFHKMSNMDDWYFSWGPGLRLLMQQLPLRLFFVSNFKMENGSVAWKDRDGDSLKSMMSSWHFVLSFNSPNR